MTDCAQRVIDLHAGTGGGRAHCHNKGFRSSYLGDTCDTYLDAKFGVHIVRVHLYCHQTERETELLNLLQQETII